MSIRVATCNARKELRGVQVDRLVASIQHLGADVILWQEVETTHHRSAIAALPGFLTYWPGGAANAVPISYRADRFSIANGRKAFLTHKGEKGVTPARYVVQLVLTTTAGVVWPVLNTHMISQAWTTHPERRGRYKKHARVLATRARVLALRYGRVVGGGDVNRSRWKPAGTVGLWAKHGTHGSAFYDLLFTRGRVALVGGVVRVQTISDHDALVARLEATA